MHTFAVRLVAAVCLAWVGGGCAFLQAGELADDLRDRFSGIKLMFCFQGKGSCLPYDAGVLDEAYRRIPALGENRVVVAGNSSGSIPAAFFSCYGFTDDNVRYAVERLTQGDRTAVRDMENPNTKFSKMLRGVRTEISHQHLREYIAFALGVQNWRDAPTIDAIVARSTARPRFPLVIVSCNKEVLEDANDADGTDSSRYKELDPATMMVSWRKEVYEFYKAHPERFAAEHPDLVLGPDRRIGRAVTFFVDRSMYELLSQIPAEERIADLRLVETASDVALAILASVSEPSYFDPIPEPDPSALLVGDVPGELGNVRKRTYYGGYVMAAPAQDVRRMLPGIRVFGTGFRHWNLLSRSAVRDWLLADVEEVMQHFEWWVDLQTTPDAEFHSHMDHRDLSNVEEVEFGRRRARQCFDADQGLPMFVVEPRLDYPAARAVMPSFDAAEMFEKASPPSTSAATAPRTGNLAGKRLKSNRGLGPLLVPAASSAGK